MATDGIGSIPNVFRCESQRQIVTRVIILRERFFSISEIQTHT